MRKRRFGKQTANSLKITFSLLSLLPLVLILETQLNRLGCPSQLLPRHPCKFHFGRFQPGGGLAQDRASPECSCWGPQPRHQAVEGDLNANVALSGWWPCGRIIRLIPSFWRFPGHVLAQSEIRPPSRHGQNWLEPPGPGRPPLPLTPTA